MWCATFKRIFNNGNSGWIDIAGLTHKRKLPSVYAIHILIETQMSNLMMEIIRALLCVDVYLGERKILLRMKADRDHLIKRLTVSNLFNTRSTRLVGFKYLLFQRLFFLSHSMGFMQKRCYNFSSFLFSLSSLSGFLFLLFLWALPRRIKKNYFLEWNLKFMMMLKIFHFVRILISLYL